MSDERPRVVIIGPPGAGKTKVGKRVARRLSLGFVDSDHRVVAKHGPIAEIFAEHGESRFREWEREEVALALRESGVVALGGGAVLDPRTQADLADLPVALVTVSAAAVEGRISGAKRPLLASGGVAAWSALVDQRMPLYEALATRRFDSSSTPMDTVAARVVEWLTEENR